MRQIRGVVVAVIPYIIYLKEEETRNERKTGFLKPA
jgi:hypothetical protein